MAKYVSITSIARKLKGRLKLSGNDEFYPVELVEEELIDDVVEEREDYVDLILGQIYELPLSQPQPTVKNIVENLVMSDLLEYSNVNGAGGQDLSSLSFSLRKKAYDVLFQLTAGTNIVIPGADMTGYIPGLTTRRLKLDGETTKSQLPETTLVHSDNLFDTITEDTNNTNFLYNDHWDNPFSMDWRNNNLGES